MSTFLEIYFKISVVVIVTVAYLTPVLYGIAMSIDDKPKVKKNDILEESLDEKDNTVSNDDSESEKPICNIVITIDSQTS